MAKIRDYSIYPEPNVQNEDVHYSYNERSLEDVPPQTKPLSPQENDYESDIKRYVSIGVGLTTLIAENLLSHPFIVLRRQCQVHNNSIHTHFVPVTLLPIMIHLHQRQGITTLWKGLGSALLVRGMSLAIEDCISKLTPWPKEIHAGSSLKMFGQHMMLKLFSFSIITPFYSASLVETVQSDIASEKPGIFDVFKSGLTRIVHWRFYQKGRMLPIWGLVLPTVVYGIMRYLFNLIVRGISQKALTFNHKNKSRRKGAISKDIACINQEIELSSALMAHIITDVAFFPFETIIHRLHLQGTRTIIDNLDSGYSVTPILTSYEGFTDCWQTILSTEGVLGLYKGFGALILQFIAHVGLIKISKVLLVEVANSVYSYRAPNNGLNPVEKPKNEKIYNVRDYSTLRPSNPPPISNMYE